MRKQAERGAGSLLGNLCWHSAHVNWCRLLHWRSELCELCVCYNYTSCGSCCALRACELCVV